MSIESKATYSFCEILASLYIQPYTEDDINIISKRMN